jgi:hypothetical protein
LPHIAQAYYAFATTIHKKITFFGMKLGRCDHFGKFFHIGRLNINNILREITQI